MYIITVLFSLGIFFVIKFVQEYKYENGEHIIYSKSQIENYTERLLNQNGIKAKIKYGKMYKSNSYLGELYIVDREKYNTYDMLSIGHEIGHLVEDGAKTHLYGHLPLFIVYITSVIYYFRCIFTTSYVGGKSFYIFILALSTSFLIANFIYTIYSEWKCSRFGKKQMKVSGSKNKEYNNFLIWALLTHAINLYIWYSGVIYLGCMIMIKI